MLGFTFAVQGTGAFPIDMLRYDRCLPNDEIDSSLIGESLCEDPFAAREEIATRTIVLRCYNRRPTPRRWETFGWKILGLGMIRKHDGTVE
jgi:hypothetical protein